MADHNPQHGRRPHFNRGRRGPDRRGSERRSPQPHAAEPGARETPREGVDVEQIMREIRSRIAQRHGIDLTTQQIQELAARRLEAILEPRNVNPSLLEQLRRSAGAAPDLPPAPHVATYTFEETTLYDTHRGILRFFRRILNPILKLFFNPGPLIHALNTQTRINTELAVREAERERRQSEWNALQYEFLQRVVTEISRVSIEMQSLAMRVESLAAKVDFNERRVRGLENVPMSGARPQPRYQEAPAAAAPSPEAATPGEPGPAADGTGDGTRRRRRRRRGRRSGGSTVDATTTTETSGAADIDDTEPGEGPELDDEEQLGVTTEGEAIEAPAPAGDLPAVPIAPQDPPAQPWPVAGQSQPSEEAVAPTVPSPPRDEPSPDNPVDHADPGPVDR